MKIHCIYIYIYKYIYKKRCFLDEMKRWEHCKLKWLVSEVWCVYTRSSVCVAVELLSMQHTGFRNRVDIHACPERRVKHIYSWAALCVKQGYGVLNSISSCCPRVWPNITPSRCDTLIRLSGAQKCHSQSSRKHPPEEFRHYHYFRLKAFSAN